MTEPRELDGVKLECPDCQGTTFTLTHHGYSYYEEIIDAQPDINWNHTHIEGETQIGDDFDASDDGWMCQKCGAFVARELQDALDSFTDLHQQRSPEEAAKIVLNNMEANT